jgi:hypothetical protein
MISISLIDNNMDSSINISILLLYSIYIYTYKIATHSDSYPQIIIIKPYYLHLFPLHISPNYNCIST